MQSISIVQDNQTVLKQQQQLLINLAMKQAFHVLQLPVLELSEWLNTEIEANPVLEVDLSKEEFKESLDDKPHFSRNRAQEEMEKRRKAHQESLLTSPISLYEHLMRQAPLVFESKQEMHIAEQIIGHLNDKGFLDTPLQEVLPSVPLAMLQRVLLGVQGMEPTGIAARDLQECLLIQLNQSQKGESTAARIVREAFDELVHNRLPAISQKLHIPISELVEIVETQIAPLDLNPGYRYYSQPQCAIVPDLIFLCIDEKWQVEINTTFLPHFHVAPVYVEALKENSLDAQEYHYLRRQVSGGKWLQRIVQRRNQTLMAIGAFVLKKQQEFFNGTTQGLVPLTMQEAANEINVHESTIARAVANKYIACPFGAFSLKSFFKQGMTTKSGQKISNHSLRELLAQTIEKEDKLRPLSDEQLSEQFNKKGIPCARRTIAKYRSALNISSASKRRKWS